MIRPDLPLDPDPRWVDDDIFPSSEYVAGYDAGWTDAARLPAVRAFFLGLLVGAAIALAAVATAVSRQ